MDTEENGIFRLALLLTLGEKSKSHDGNSVVPSL